VRGAECPFTCQCQRPTMLTQWGDRPALVGHTFIYGSCRADRLLWDFSKHSRTSSNQQYSSSKGSRCSCGTWAHAVGYRRSDLFYGGTFSLSYKSVFCHRGRAGFPLRTGRRFVVGLQHPGQHSRWLLAIAATVVLAIAVALMNKKRLE
jgi:hypothetical protein